MAAILGSVTLQVGTVILPSFTAFQDVFWMAGLSALLACGVVSYIKPPVRGPAVAGGKAERPRPTAAVTEAGENTEFVVRGSIQQSDDSPIHPAVITVMKIDGTPVDWSRADNQGHYSVVLPGPGRYLVLANGQGWTPRAEVLQFRDENTHQHITLTDQLTPVRHGPTRRGARR